MDKLNIQETADRIRYAVAQGIWPHAGSTSMPACAVDQYIALDADEALSRFLVNGWPDEELFREMVIEVLNRARKNDRRVRAFGEMVAIMWARGLSGATVQLEHLWHEFCQTEKFSLFCAYPKSGFTEDSCFSLKKICAAHSNVIPE